MHSGTTLSLILDITTTAYIFALRVPKHLHWDLFYPSITLNIAPQIRLCLIIIGSCTSYGTVYVICIRIVHPYLATKGPSVKETLLQNRASYI